MIGRLIGGAVVAAALGGATAIFGFKGYQAYLRWLVAELPQNRPQEAQPPPDAVKAAAEG